MTNNESTWVCPVCSAVNESADTECRAFGMGCGFSRPVPTWSKPCEACGETVERYRGEGDVSCSCGAEYNAGGQRLRDDWRYNPAWGDDDMDDMEGFERECLSREGF